MGSETTLPPELLNVTVSHLSVYQTVPQLGVFQVASHSFVGQEFGQDSAGWFFCSREVSQGDAVVLKGLEGPGELHSHGGHVAMTVEVTLHPAVPARWPRVVSGAPGRSGAR